MSVLLLKCECSENLLSQENHFCSNLYACKKHYHALSIYFLRVKYWHKFQDIGIKTSYVPYGIENKRKTTIFNSFLSIEKSINLRELKTEKSIPFCFSSLKFIRVNHDGCNFKLLPSSSILFFLFFKIKKSF